MTAATIPPVTLLVIVVPPKVTANVSVGVDDVQPNVPQRVNRIICPATSELAGIVSDCPARMLRQ